MEVLPQNSKALETLFAQVLTSLAEYTSSVGILVPALERKMNRLPLQNTTRAYACQSRNVTRTAIEKNPELSINIF